MKEKPALPSENEMTKTDFYGAIKEIFIIPKFMNV